MPRLLRCRYGLKADCVFRPSHGAGMQAAGAHELGGKRLRGVLHQRRDQPQGRPKRSDVHVEHRCVKPRGFASVGIA